MDPAQVAHWLSAGWLIGAGAAARSGSGGGWLDGHARLKKCALIVAPLTEFRIGIAAE